MILPFTKLETHPSGTPDPNGIITANWPLIETILLASSFWIKTPNIDGKSATTTTLANASDTLDHPAGYNYIVDKCLFVPINFTGIATLPQIEIGEDVVGTNSLVAAVTPTATATQIQDLTLLNPRPRILPTGSLKVKVDTVATGTNALFQIWLKVLAQ